MRFLITLAIIIAILFYVLQGMANGGAWTLNLNGNQIRLQMPNANKQSDYNANKTQGMPISYPVQSALPVSSNYISQRVQSQENGEWQCIAGQVVSGEVYANKEGDSYSKCYDECVFIATQINRIVPQVTPAINGKQEGGIYSWVIDGQWTQTDRECPPIHTIEITAIRERTANE